MLYFLDLAVADEISLFFFRGFREVYKLSPPWPAPALSLCQGQKFLVSLVDLPQPLFRLGPICRSLYIGPGPIVRPERGGSRTIVRNAAVPIPFSEHCHSHTIVSGMQRFLYLYPIFSTVFSSYRSLGSILILNIAYFLVPWVKFKVLSLLPAKTACLTN